MKWKVPRKCEKWTESAMCFKPKQAQAAQLNGYNQLNSEMT